MTHCGTACIVQPGTGQFYLFSPVVSYIQFIMFVSHDCLERDFY